MITCLKDLADRAMKMKMKTVVAVVEAHDEHTLESVIDSYTDGIILPRLIGRKAKIEEMLASFGAEPSSYDIIPTESATESLDRAAEMIDAGAASAIMKGGIESDIFIKSIINVDNHLLIGGKLSIAGFFSPPKYHKMLAVSDMALNTYPDLDDKKSIIENAVRMMNALGIETPKVAVLASVEKVNPKMPETLDAYALKQMNLNGEIKNCIVEGPISFDLATSEEAARIKGYESPVAGDADLLIVPDITAGNILVKCLTGFAGAQTAGTVLGARAPVIFTSRSAEASDKYFSIALAACLSTG